VSPESVVLIPSCAECDALWLPPDEERWRAYHKDDELVADLEKMVERTRVELERLAAATER
jgi:hypothetical protein